MAGHKYLALAELARLTSGCTTTAKVRCTFAACEPRRWAVREMKKRAIVAALGLAAGLTSGTGYACICPRAPSIEEFEARVGQLGLDTWIFVGTVTNSGQKTSTAIVRLKMMVGEVRELFGGEPYWAPDDLRKVVQFSIRENFRGPTSESNLEASSGNCGPFFEVGKQYLVVATRKTHKDPWLAEGCTPTAPVEKAAESIRILRLRKSVAGSDCGVHHINHSSRVPNNALQATCEDARA